VFSSALRHVLSGNSNRALLEISQDPVVAGRFSAKNSHQRMLGIGQYGLIR
jgi:hypothetical protein